MLHGAFFIGTPADGYPVTAKDAKDDNVRKFLGRDAAHLVGVTVFGSTVDYVRITNDLWKNSQYLEIPSFGTILGSGILWLPSPIRIMANSTWTITGHGCGGDTVGVILLLSYDPVYKVAGGKGVVCRKVSHDTPTAGNWFEIGTISDLDPTRKFIITGVVAESDTNYTYAVRLKADSFEGMIPVYPATTKGTPDPVNLLEFIREGMPVYGTQTVTVEVYQVTQDPVRVYVFFAEE